MWTNNVQLAEGRLFLICSSCHLRPCGACFSYYAVVRVMFVRPCCQKKRMVASFRATVSIRRQIFDNCFNLATACAGCCVLVIEFLVVHHTDVNLRLTDRHQQSPSRTGCFIYCRRDRSVCRGVASKNDCYYSCDFISW